MSKHDAQRSAPQPRTLRPSGKVLPEHARGHNRSLVLQNLYRGGLQSRADLARETRLTRVTISDLVAELIDDGLVVETGPREKGRPGKPAILLDINRNSYRIIGIDLSDTDVFRGAVLDLDGGIVSRVEAETGGALGDEVTAIVVRLVRDLLAASDLPVLGVGIGSPGIVDLDGRVLSAPNLGWEDLPLRALVEATADLPVIVANDANVAVLAEHSFGDVAGDLMVIRVGLGVGAGLILGDTPVFGGRYAAGEIGHVVVGTDGGAECVCGKRGCLETWLSVPRLRTALAGATDTGSRDGVLRRAGERLGIALAPVVGALDLDEVVISGPVELLDGPLTEAAVETLRARTMATFHGDLRVRMSDLGQDIVMRGAAAMVLSGRLGVS